MALDPRFYSNFLSAFADPSLATLTFGFFENLTVTSDIPAYAAGLSVTGGRADLSDDIPLRLGTVASLLWETADANANKLLLELPAGGSVDVPVLVIGQSISNVDLGLHNGTVDPLISVLAAGAVTSAAILEFRKARGTVAAPTVCTTGDDLGTINFYGCVAAGEYVQSASIRADIAGTIATTRGPGTLTFLTATDAAPSVLTAALTISAAQLVTCAAGLTVTTGSITVSSGNVVLTSGNLTLTSGGLTLTSGNVTVTAATDIIATANLAAALEITDGTTSLFAIDTRNTVTVQNFILQGPASQTLPNGATSRVRIFSMPAKTVTLAGTTQVTTEMLGAQMFIDAITIAQSGGAVTVDRVSGLHVGTPVAGSMVTITANHIISTGTGGCFCTAAGTWTDTCSANEKLGIKDADLDEMPKLLEKVRSRSFRKKDASDGGFQRYGIIAEEVPDFLADPGRKGVGAMNVAGFALAVSKYQQKVIENQERTIKDLIGRLEKLEAAA